MKKTPLWGNALLILRTHHEHDTQKVYKNFIRFSLDILQGVPYRRTRSREALA
jgi:hypothetical protein